MGVFSKEERRGLIFLMPLLLVALLLIMLAEWRDAELIEEPVTETSPKSVVLQKFDPNTFEYEELREAGISADIAAGIIRWRRYGKVYRMKEDLALVTGVTDSIYALLKPYIIIADSLTPKPRNFASDNQSNRMSDSQSDISPLSRFTPERFLIDTVSASYLTRWGFSPKQADVVVRYRDASGGIRSEEQLRRCYVVSDEMADMLLPYIIFSPATTEGEEMQPISRREQVAADQQKNSLVEINSADSATLVAINGIGAKSATEILKYRTLLGGYHSVEQISELDCITESNFEKILQQICCDSCNISKIDINFAGPKELERHPYISARALRRIVKQRQLKGGWSKIEEMIDDDILSEEEAERLAPYLRFRLEATE